MKYILSIDQGTTSSRAILFNKQMKIEAIAQQEITPHFPKSGWVEHNPLDIWTSVAGTCRSVMEKIAVKAKDIVSIGITNQRETTIVWDKNTGETIYNAIVWQDRRTSAYCDELKQLGYEEEFRDKTGLMIDPYFSGFKLKWILDNVQGARQKAIQGDLLFGTVDSYLIWKLTDGKSHLTDATNASRTILYNIRTNQWDEEICKILDIPMNMLPEVKNCADEFGKARADIFGEEIAIQGVAGDQQSACIGQACFEPGMMKSTYGTGCFALLNIGQNMVLSKNKLLTTIAYKLDNKTTYALEGSIFIAGAVVQWLRDGLGIIKDAKDTHELANNADTTQQIYMVPAFTGLGAPYWDTRCRGSIFGITGNTGPKELSKAALESVGYQTRDLFEAMKEDIKNVQVKESILRVDGGMSASNWSMQFLADILGTSIHRPEILETTALGAAWLAGMKAGFYPKKDAFCASWKLEKDFKPQISQELRAKLYAGWKDAVKRTLSSMD